MNWENIEFLEEEKESSSLQTGASTEDMSVETEDRKLLQLAKFQDPITNIERQKYIALMNRFSELIVKQSLEEIKDELLTESCLCFLLNLFEDANVVYSQGNEGFLSLYRSTEIREKRTRTTHIDVEKKTGCQISECKIVYNGSSEMTDQVMFELFNFEDSRICKYRAGFGLKTVSHGVEDAFDLTRKDLMLAKVKELNCALADQSNLDRIASLLHESTEYKIWSWDGQKCFTFHKCDLVNNFHSLEENFAIERIVPYEVYSETTEIQYIISTYVYHLKDKVTFPGTKYVWLSTSVFTFDHDLNIMRICQQGELYPENEASIPFEAFSTDEIKQRALDLILFLQKGPEIFYSGKADFNCTLARYGPKESPTIGLFQGMKQVEKLQKSMRVSSKKIDWTKVPEIFVDFNGPSYDAVFLSSIVEATLSYPEYKYCGQLIDFLGMSVYLFENGKVTKIYQFYIDVPEIIISPFDDQDIEGVTVKPLKYIL